MIVNEIMFALIRNEVFGAPISPEIKAALNAENLKELYKISKRQDLAHLICDALERNDLLPDDSEVASKFRKQHLTAVYRYERMNFELGMVSKTFEEEKIPYMPLKGSVIRAYYPEPWMRTSCDIDILVKEEDLERAEGAIVSKLGYVSKGKQYHDVSLTSPSGVHLELHFKMGIADYRSARSGRILNDIWQYVVTSSDAYRCTMPDDWFYLYHIAHMTKHTQIGGCGVRPFLDLYLLDTKVEHDEAKRNELLDRAGLLKFAETARQLACKWFACGKSSEVADTLERFVFEGNTYGSVNNGIVIDMVKKGGRTKYILSRLFMPYDQLKVKYPIIKKHRWLTPLFEVVRWFSVLSPARMKRTKNELEVSGDSWNVAMIENFFEEMGLQCGVQDE